MRGTSWIDRATCGAGMVDGAACGVGGVNGVACGVGGSGRDRGSRVVRGTVEGDMAMGGMR